MLLPGKTAAVWHQLDDRQARAARRATTCRNFSGEERPEPLPCSRTHAVVGEHVIQSIGSWLEDQKDEEVHRSSWGGYKGRSKGSDRAASRAVTPTSLNCWRTSTKRGGGYKGEGRLPEARLEAVDR